MDLEIVQAIEKAISRADGRDLKIRSMNPVGGGSINRAFKAETSLGNFFVKLNDADAYPGMFEAEAHGLDKLRKANSMDIPAVIASGETDGHSFLVLEWIESGRRAKNFFEDFGKRLAKLHGNTSELFGLERDNYIGSLMQFNKPAQSFSEFFILQRLEVQLKTAIDYNKLPSGICSSLEKLYSKLNEIIPPEKPALLHGDFWSGNFMTGANGFACIFDPAVYYGHRESDLAMSLLFGGFNQEFYETYHSHFPLESNWRKRTDIFNLYPLLVHVNLFGGSYTNEVMSIVKRF